MAKVVALRAIASTAAVTRSTSGLASACARSTSQSTQTVKPACSATAGQNIGYSDHNQHAYWHFKDINFSPDGTLCRRLHAAWRLAYEALAWPKEPLVVPKRWGLAHWCSSGLLALLLVGGRQTAILWCGWPQPSTDDFAKTQGVGQYG